MIKILRAVAFALVVLMAIAATRPFSSSETYAAERSPHRVRLTENDRSRVHQTTARTVGEFLEEKGIVLHPYDKLVPNINSRISNDHVTVRIDRAFYLNVLLNGDKEQIKVSPGTTSGEVLGSLQTSMDTALLFNGDEGRAVDDETVLEFSTWRSRVETVIEPIPYPSEYVSTASLSQGVEQLRQKGIAGERHLEYMVVYVANEEYTRELMEETIIEPVAQIIDRGIGSVADTLGTLTDTACPSFHYVRRVVMNASAYTAGFNCTGKHPWHPLYGITASGRRVEHGIVAVDPNVIPLGTRLYVEGYGFALAADTGSAIRGYMIDLFMYDLDDARRFGRRDLTVFILD